MKHNKLKNTKGAVKMKIFIDPGHGGSDSGACANGILEKTINLTTALKVKDYLQECGMEVKLSREDDYDVGLSERCVMANNWGANYFISIHHNAGGGIGYEIIHAVAYGKGTELANETGKVFDSIGRKKHGIYSKEGSNGDYFCVIRETKMSAIITEYAYIDSDDVNAVNTDEGLDREARAIVKGLCNYLNIQFGGDLLNTDSDTQPQQEQLQESPQPHWAQKYFDYLNESGLVIEETRFDDAMTRGEVFKLLAEMKGFNLPRA